MCEVFMKNNTLTSKYPGTIRVPTLTRLGLRPHAPFAVGSSTNNSD